MHKGCFMYNVFVIALLQYEVRWAGFRDLKVKVYGLRPQRKSNMIFLLLVTWWDIKRWELCSKTEKWGEQTNTDNNQEKYVQ